MNTQEVLNAATQVIHKLKKANYEAYFVGGAVRDWLLKKDFHDIDIATSASVEEMELLFEHIIPVGKKHGTVIVRINKVSIEVSSFRKNDKEALDSPATINTDLASRDFTINAIAMDEQFTVYDPYFHQKDLHDKIIRGVGNIYERFSEDPLRIVRAIRFVATLGFTLDEATEVAIIQRRESLSTVAIERIVKELDKLLMGSYVKEAVDTLLKTGLLSCIPVLANYGQALQHYCTYPYQTLPTKEERWALLFYLYHEERRETFFHGMKCSNQLKKEVQQLASGVKYLFCKGWDSYFLYQVGLNKAQKIKRLIAVLHPESTIKKLEEIEEEYHRLPIKTRKELEVNGKDLLDFFKIEPGKWLEDYLQLLEKGVVQRKIKNRKAELLQWIKKEVDEDEGKIT